MTLAELVDALQALESEWADQEVVDGNDRPIEYVTPLPSGVVRVRGR